MLDEKLDEWGYFRAVGDYEREQLLQTEFAFGKSGPDTDRFCDAVSALNDGDTLQFTWQDEPDATTWHISRRWKYVYVEVHPTEEGIYLPYEVFCKAIGI